MADNITKLRNLLAELFMFEFAELDFGIYRIMNSKRADIQRFLDQDLLPQVRTELGKVGSGERAGIEADLAKSIQQAEVLGADPESLPKVKVLRERLATADDPAALEDEVFSLLAAFFRRYYKDGDYLALRRYKKDVYALPYEGEEVKLHWANADQYYIKSSEYFRDYVFKLPDGRRVHFKLTEADTEQNNNKTAGGRERRFVLLGQETLAEDDGELFIRFLYRIDPEKQATLNRAAAAQILELAKAGFATWLEGLQTKAPTEKDAGRTLLEKHLTDYSARNSFDYFIHKDLGGFLCRELDFFIKSEVMLLDDIEEDTAPRVEQYLAKVRAVRRIARKIIDMLAQLEGFQKRLWLKKKFVVETNYCVTLDRVPEELYPEIAANAAQREEWVRLFAIDELVNTTVSPNYSTPLTVDFLKANPFLVLDTQFFLPAFKARLLASFDNLDAQLDGLLIHSENFQALNLLQERYIDQVCCIYIDPPYNTGPTEILYKNNYKKSSWLSLMSNRLSLSRSLIKESDGVLCVAIDDYELVDLVKLLESIMEGYEINPVIVNHHPQGSGGANISRTHEYSLFVIPEGEDILRMKRLTEKRADSDENQHEHRPYMRSGTAENNFRIGRPNSFYAVLIDPTTNKAVGVERPPEIGHIYPRHTTLEGFQRTYPLGGDGSERVWRLSYESAAKAVADDGIYCSPKGTLYQVIKHKRPRTIPFSNWTDKKYNAGTQGTNLIADILGAQGAFSYPKSLYTVIEAIDITAFRDDEAIVLDYFAGSGTTAHAVIALNREDDTNRKYIMVEMGDYFDAVTKPRILKVIYSKDWKDGKPVSRAGSSHLLKYIRLESYEDALNNLDMRRSELQAQLLAEEPSLREDYMLRYMLDIESRGSASLLNIAAFAHPFHYTLKISTGSVGETRDSAVDLVETFNYLLGLRVRQIDTIREVVTVQGLNPEGQRVLIIWRDVEKLPNDELDIFFQKQGYTTRDQEFDLIYVNGDNNLENLRRDDETWKVRLTEQEFQRLMFDVRDV